jgi:hypothetical protein
MIKGSMESAIISGVSRISNGRCSKWRRDFPSSEKRRLLVTSPAPPAALALHVEA